MWTWIWLWTTSGQTHIEDWVACYGSISIQEKGMCKRTHNNLTCGTAKVLGIWQERIKKWVQILYKTALYTGQQYNYLPAVLSQQLSVIASVSLHPGCGCGHRHGSELLLGKLTLKIECHVMVLWSLIQEKGCAMKLMIFWHVQQHKYWRFDFWLEHILGS